MKTQIYKNRIFIYVPRLFKRLPLITILVFCLLSAQSFSQSVDIVSPATNVTYKLPDPAGAQTPAELQGAITTAEIAAKVLNTDAVNEKANLTGAENDFNNAQTQRSSYLAALDDYVKNGYNPYMVDYNSYTPNVTQYNETLKRHNIATEANNALAPSQRNAANVASLNSEKTELDNWNVKLDTWKSSLDAAKAKLDAQRAVLLQQKQQYETLNQSATEKLKGSRQKLKSILDQLTLCANYAEKCKALQVSKFNYAGTSVTGYFGTSVYKGALADLNTDLEKLRNLSGMVWDGN